MDDTLLVIKKKDFDLILNNFNSFNKNLKFTIEIFENCVSNSLEVETCHWTFKNVTYIIYHKNIQAAQDTNTEPFTLWKWKVERIFSRSHLDKEIKLNGHPKRIVHAITKRALKNNDNIIDQKKLNESQIKVFFILNYLGETAERMVNNSASKTL